MKDAKNVTGFAILHVNASREELHQDVADPEMGATGKAGGAGQEARDADTPDLALYQIIAGEIAATIEGEALTVVKKGKRPIRYKGS